MPFEKPPVPKSADFLRIKGLPSRGAEFYPSGLIQEMTRILKTPSGNETLFDVQSRALYDIGMGGEMAHGRRPRGFLPIKVGGGKTLVSFLAPRMVGAKRPILILPASLIEKTERGLHTAAANWLVAKHLKIMSYQKIGRVEGANALDLYNPDMIILDECHFAKNPRAAVTRRLARYIQAHPQVIVIVMSGTIMKGSIKDFAHLLAWTHGQHSPLPLHSEILSEWADALDEGLNPFSRRSAGVLNDLGPCPDALLGEGDDEDDTKRARLVFQHRLNSTLGVVSADAKDEYTGSLLIEPLEYHPNQATEDNFRKLREEMARPDGWTLSEAMQVWAVARMLSLGLHYRWNPDPEDEWLDARKAWAKFVRDTLTSPAAERAGIDSELQVTNAVLNGHLEDPFGLLADWQAIKPTFDVNPEPVWHDDTALKVCCNWLADHPAGIVWVEHRYFAKTLSQLSGVPYFGAKGLDAKGTSIMDAPAGKPIIASIAANSTGRDLQHKWHDNLVTAPPADSERWEQLIARTHRYGQKADSVTVDVLLACREHLEAIPRALSSADVKADLLGMKASKLRVADINWPDRMGKSGPRWA